MPKYNDFDLDLQNFTSSPYLSSSVTDDMMVSVAMQLISNCAGYCAGSGGVSHCDRNGTEGCY